MEMEEIVKKLGVTEEQLKFIGLGAVLTNKDLINKFVSENEVIREITEIKKTNEEKGNFNCYPEVRTKKINTYEVRLSNKRENELFIHKELVDENDESLGFKDKTKSQLYAVIKGKVSNGKWRAKNILLRKDGLCYTRAIGATNKIPSRHKMSLEEAEKAAERIGGKIIDIPGENSYCIQIEKTDENFIKTWLVLWNEI